MKLTSIDADRQAAMENLDRKALSIKLRFLRMYFKANAGHIGCSLSCAEILTFIRFAWMKDGDKMVLSKGHAAGALYSVLAEAGDLTEQQIDSFYQDGTLLAAHPPASGISAIPFATGSLGHGLSLSCGLALGSRLKKQNQHIYCVTSDGELNEGSTWEAGLFAAHHQLTNLIWFVDRNGLQGFGRTEDVMGLEPLVDKLTAFGWHVIEADGHAFVSLFQAKTQALEYLKTHSKPVVILCRTIKGRGISFMADTVDCHYLPLKEPQYRQAVAELTGQISISVKASPR